MHLVAEPSAAGILPPCWDGGRTAGGWRETDAGEEGKNSRPYSHGGSRSGSFIADMQEESPCSTKICLYTNFFVTFSVLFSLQLDFSQRVTVSEGRPNLLLSALLAMSSDTWLTSV